MKKLLKYSETSTLMGITIEYNGEKINFNLFDEIVVDENKINHEIKVQPSSYAFLNMLYKKLIRVSKDKEKTMERKYAHLFIKYKSETDPLTNRPFNNDIAMEMVKKNKEYQKSLTDYHDAQHNADILEVCVKAFEQRYSLIQTLSANIRKNG